MFEIYCEDGYGRNFACCEIKHFGQLSMLCRFCFHTYRSAFVVVILSNETRSVRRDVNVRKGAARNEWQVLPRNPCLWVCVVTVCERFNGLRQQSFIYIRLGLRLPAPSSAYVAMTQQEQAEFGHSLEAALSWMRAAHERLRVNDNTQGPRAALEARLRETEDIRESEHEGRIKMDKVLAVADVLLNSGDDEVKRETHAKLKELKAFWDETTTYITHCHCRIEWVWLHWSEYLKVHEEFAVWLGKMRCTLEPQLELQLDMREKLWQLDHHQVLLSDVHGQAELLERLLEEALALYSRTEDPSVGPEALQVLQDAYNQIRDKAAERVTLLQKIVKDHQTYDGRGQKFLAWLASKSAELNDCSEAEDPEKKLQVMQDLWKSVSCEEETLQDIETLAEAVKAQTSPAGAEAITKEVEHLREAWENLMQLLLLQQERLQTTRRSIADHEARVEQLRADVAQLRRVLQAQGRELEGSGGERTEEQMVTAWRKYTKVHAALAMEEPAVEKMKTRLRELFHFSQGNTGPLSDDVVAMIKEYQGVKSRAFQLSTEAQADLRKVLQDPLRGCKQWTVLASEVLRSSEETSEFSHLALLVQKMEKLLKHSLQLQERLSLLQVKGDLLSSVFGSDKAEDVLTELSAAMKDREQLHSQLAQKKRHLQDLLQKSNGFGEAYDSISKQLDQIKERLNAADGLQPDILAKKSQFDQFVIMKKDLEDCETHVSALETLVSSLTNRHMFDQLHAEWRELYKTVRVKANESERSIAEHENFHESLLTVEKWLMIMRQKLESFCGADGEWSVQNRRTEAERALGEFPEKELQLHKTEAQGQLVLSRTSEEGRVHILRDLHRLRESWLSLHTLSLNVFRLLNGEGAAGVREVSSMEEMVDKIGSDRDSFLTESEHTIKGNKSELVSGCGIKEEAGWDALSRAEGTIRGAGPSTRGGFGVGVDSTRKPLGNSDVDLQSSVLKGGRSGIQCEEPDGIDLRMDHGSSGKGLHLAEDMVEKTMMIARAGGRSDGNFGFGGDFGVERSSDSSVKAEKSAAGTSFWVEASGDSDACKKHLKGGSQRRTEDSKQRGASDYESWRGAGLDVGNSPSGSGQDAYGKYAEGSHAWNKWQNKGVDMYAADKTPKLRSGGAIGAEDESTGERRRTTKDGSVHRRLIPDPEFQGDTKLLREFEVWLKAENDKLSRILGNKGQINAAERKETLKDLRSRVGWGQSQLQKLLALWGVGAVTAQAGDLEELRYRWMLYKSKLKDAGDLNAPLQPTDARVLREESVIMRKKRSRFLSRVCWAALPLQLLLLGLLLLAFLLPLTDEGASCSLANNFARSFSIMLRYHGPPPT